MTRAHAHDARASVAKQQVDQAMQKVKHTTQNIKKHGDVVKKRFWNAEKEMQYVLRVHGEKSLLTRGAQFWHGHRTQLILVGLLLLDVIIVFVEVRQNGTCCAHRKQARSIPAPLSWAAV